MAAYSDAEIEHWFADRVEITSPGGLYGRNTPENFGTGDTDYRNPLLAEVMYTSGSRSASDSACHSPAKPWLHTAIRSLSSDSSRRGSASP